MEIKSKFLVFLVIPFLLGGCSSIKMFQKKVPEAPKTAMTITPPVKDGLLFIQDNLPTLEAGEVVSPEKADKQAQVKDMVSVLVNRVGRTPEPELDFEKLKKSLQKEVIVIAKEEEKVNKFLISYGGGKIEGTGLEISALWANVFPILILIVLCVLFPALLPLITGIINAFIRIFTALFNAIVERARATKTAKQTAKAIDNYVADTSIPEDVKKALKTYLKTEQDTDVKAYINKLQGK